LTGYDKMLPMNSGAEAVETALKMARKWGYTVKGVEAGQAEVIVCDGNFAGRTITVVGFSSEGQYQDGFGPFTPGFVRVPYGDAAALEAARASLHGCGYPSLGLLHDRLRPRQPLTTYASPGPTSRP